MIRIGGVSYLNTKVLIYGMEPQTEVYTMDFGVPSLQSRRLREGELDVALVSSIEYFRNPDYVMLPDMAIASQREIWSVQLFYRGSLREARRVALDPSSETSNALLQIILYERLQLGIELVRLPLDADPLQHPDLDGFLKIGDPCLKFLPPPGYQALDLANEWYMFTNLPFVFAAWMARKGVELEGVNKTLFLAKRQGLRNVDEIARYEAPRIGLDYQRVKTYIQKIVRYDLGRTELAGMDLFRKYLIRQGLTGDHRPLEFYTR